MRKRLLGSGLLAAARAKSKNNHGQCQAADDESGGDRGDSRPPDATGKDTVPSVKMAEG